MTFCTCLFQIYLNHSESHCNVEAMHSCWKSIFAELITLIANAVRACRVSVHIQLLYVGPLCIQGHPHLPIGNAEMRQSQMQLKGATLKAVTKSTLGISCVIPTAAACCHLCCRTSVRYILENSFYCSLWYVGVVTRSWVLFWLKEGFSQVFSLIRPIF